MITTHFKQFSSLGIPARRVHTGEFVKYVAKNQVQHGQPEKVRAGYKFTAELKRPITWVIGNSTSMAAARGVSFENLLGQFKSVLNGY
jgi:hypothetical protein